MPRLRNEATGAVVSVPQEKVERLGPGWAPVEPEAPDPQSAPNPRPRRSRSKSDD